MSDYNKLAQRIVALGFADLLTLPEPHHGRAYQFPAGEPDSGTLFLSADAFCNDGRVVLALMEKMSSVHAYWDDIGWSCKATEKWVDGRDTGVGNVDAYDKQYYPPAIAICEACCDALENNDG